MPNAKDLSGTPRQNVSVWSSVLVGRSKEDLNMALWASMTMSSPVSSRSNAATGS